MGRRPSLFVDGAESVHLNRKRSTTPDADKTKNATHHCQSSQGQRCTRATGRPIRTNWTSVSPGESLGAGLGELRPHPATREGAAMDNDTSIPRPPAGVVDDDHRF